MPMFVSTNGVLITVIALLHRSFALTKLSVAPSLGTYPPTTEPFFNATMTTKTNPGVTTEQPVERYSYRDGRYLQNTNNAYRWHGITQPQQHLHQQTLQTDYAYSDYSSTSPEEPSTLTYPFITTQRPIPRQVKFRPRVTKLQVKSVRRGQNGMNMFADSESFEEPDSDFVPLVTLYGSQISRWSTMPTHHASPYTYGGGTQPAEGFTGFGGSSTGGASSFGHTGLTFTGGSSSTLEDLHQSASHHHVPILTQIHHSPKFDMKKIGILALVKIGLAKLKAFGILKLIFILLFKLKLFLLAMFIKFVLFMKLLKVLKSLLIPLILLAVFIPLLLALLALPILLAPLLYPLISMLPIIPAINIRPKSRIHFLKDQENENETKDTLTSVMDQLLSSTQCIERIACEMATKKEAKFFFPFVNW